MNVKGIKIFSICIFVVFAFAICFFGFTVFNNIKIGKDKAAESLNSVILDTIEYINYYGFSESFTQKFTEYVQSNKDIAGLIITQDSNTCFAFPVSSPIIKIDNFGDPVIQGSSPIISIFSSSLPVDNYTKVNITTAIYLIHPDKIFSIAKICFLIILVATALVFAVLISVYKNNPTTENSTEIISTTEKNETFKNNENEINNYSETEKNTYGNNEQIINETNNSLETQNDNPQIDEEIKEQVVSPDYKPLASNISDPQGLFSEYTGFGWESYFETRLDSEIARSASSEQDLALFLIKIENITFQNHIIPYLTNILLEKFKFRDLIFEFGTNGFAAIVQGIDLDRAMALGQDLYTEISGLLINKQMNNKLGIGITTRSLRLITGNRLIEESSQALEKAFEEQGLPIVAFRVNPDKYRQYLINED